MRRLLMVPFALLASQAWADLEFELGVGHRFTGSSGFDQFSGARESNSYASPVEQSRLKSLNEVSFRVFYPRTSSLQIGAAFDWMIPGSSETQVFPSQESAVKKTSRQRGWTVGPSFIYQLERFQESHTPLTLGFEPQLGLLVVQQDWQGSTNGALTAQALSYRFNLFAQYLIRLTEKWGIHARAGYLVQGSSGYVVTKSEGSIYSDLSKGSNVYFNSSTQEKMTTTYHGPYVALSAHLGSSSADDENIFKRPSDSSGENAPSSTTQPLPPPATLLPEESLEGMPFMRLSP